MDKTATIKLIEKLVFIYLLLFPFGQLLVLNTSILGTNIRVHPSDLVVLVFLPILLSKKIQIPKVLGCAGGLGFLLIFGLIFSFNLFDPKHVFIGAMYLIRLFGYLAFLVAVYNLVKVKTSYKKTLLHGLIVITAIVAILGMVQYLVLPDLRFLYYFGWDDHLFRLTGTFLDPGFTGIILCFGALLVTSAYLGQRKKIFLLTLIFLVASLLLTYSRASFAAFLVGQFSLFVKTRRKLPLLISAIFLVAVFFLPRPGGEGVRLERTRSVVLRIQNYRETFEIFRRSPVFGIGFNNLCVAREKFLEDKNPKSHSCNGSDSSLLLILATSGILGIILVGSLVKTFLDRAQSQYSPLFISCLAALIIHSQFVNSLVYPWVMGYLAILGGISEAGSRG